MAEGLKFGTSGLRGLVGELTPEVCAAYTTAFLAHLEAGGKGVRSVLVGRDLRESSPAIAASCMEAAFRAGCEAFDCGALPTPALALAAMARRLPAIMVTGSHIPADRNGLKFYRPEGEITKEDEAGIVGRLHMTSAAGAPTGASKDEPAALADYRRRYLSAPAFALGGLRVGLYQHSSVARDLFVDILGELGAVVVPLGRSDVFVPVDTEALAPQDAEATRAWAVEHGLDAIVSTDGDADRPLVADERGVFLRGDVVGILTASFLGAEIVVTPVTSTSAVEACGRFARVVRTRVGSPFVIAGMEAEAGQGTIVGFEANGGVLLGSDVARPGLELSALPTRDALLPILAVLATARSRGRRVSELVAELPPRFTSSDRLVHVPAATSLAFLATLDHPEVLARFVEGLPPLAGSDRTDGLRLELGGGETLHFRPSGNAPELRCYAEASTAERAAELLAGGLARAAEAIRRL